MVDAGFTITRAIQSRSWPGVSTHLEYAAVWGTRDRVAEDVPRVADDVEAARITTLLEPGGRVEGRPIRLAENAGIAFQGCIVLGKGFIIDPDEAQGWIDAGPAQCRGPVPISERRGPQLPAGLLCITVGH